MKGSEAQKQSPRELLWMLWFDKKSISNLDTMLNMLDCDPDQTDLWNKEEEKIVLFGTLTEEDMKQLLAKTSYNKEEIMQWHFDFFKECPNGKLSKVHLQRLFSKVFPNLPFKDTENFVTFIFRLFDIDHSNILEFNEFLQVNKLFLITLYSPKNALIRK